MDVLQTTKNLVNDRIFKVHNQLVASKGHVDSTWGFYVRIGSNRGVVMTLNQALERSMKLSREIRFLLLHSLCLLVLSKLFKYKLDN